MASEVDHINTCAAPALHRSEPWQLDPAVAPAARCRLRELYTVAVYPASADCATDFLAQSGWEIWFSILERKSLQRASFTSVEQLRKHIDAFIETYNRHATPFVRTKATVHQKRLKGRRISQL